jgi:hypothetical protein
MQLVMNQDCVAEDNNGVCAAPNCQTVLSVAPQPEECFAYEADDEGSLGWWEVCTQQLRREVYVAYFVCRHPRIPWSTKLVVASAVGYVFSQSKLDGHRPVGRNRRHPHSA